MCCWQMLTRAIESGDIDTEDLSALSTSKVICAPNSVVTLPEWIFFDDRPGLAAKFGTFLQDNAISRPQGAWQAMAAAGVRRLSDAVDSHLAEIDDPVET